MGVRVLQVVQSLDFGGLERVVINLVRNLNPRFHCDVLCLRFEGRFAEELQTDGYSVRSFEIGRGKSLGMAHQLAGFIRDGGYSIVQSHDTTPLLYTALAKLIYRNFRHIYTEHSGIYSCLSRHRLMTWFALASVDHAIMVSNDLRSYYKKHFPLTRAKISVIYNGLDFPAAPSEARNSVCEEFGIPVDSTIVGTTVRFYPQKGLRYLVQTIPSVLDIYPEARFLLVGDGVERQMLEKIVDDYGHRNRVIFAGFRQDIPRLIGAMDVYVLPSLWEGLPLALIEALMAGKAVIATKVGGTPELIQDGKTGFLVPPRSSEALIEKLDLLISSPDLRQAFGENGRTLALERFSLSRMIAAYENLYKTMNQKNYVR